MLTGCQSIPAIAEHVATRCHGPGRPRSTLLRHAVWDHFGTIVLLFGIQVFQDYLPI